MNMISLSLERVVTKIWKVPQLNSLLCFFFFPLSIHFVLLSLSNQKVLSIANVYTLGSF